MRSSLLLVVVAALGVGAAKPVSAQGGTKSWNHVCAPGIGNFLHTNCVSAQLEWTATTIDLKLRNESGLFGSPLGWSITEFSIYNLPYRTFLPSFDPDESHYDYYVKENSLQVTSLESPGRDNGHMPDYCLPDYSNCTVPPWDWSYQTGGTSFDFYTQTWPAGGLANTCDPAGLPTANDNLIAWFKLTPCGEGWMEMKWSEREADAGRMGPLNLSSAELSIEGRCDTGVNCFSVTTPTSSVPEPGSLALFATGLAAIGMVAKRRMREGYSHRQRHVREA